MFIGRHDDFPNIALPAAIGGTPIVLLTSKQADQRMKHRKALTYLNIIGTVTADQTQFLIVTFLVQKKNGAVSYLPQHNCHVSFTYNPGKKLFEPAGLRFEHRYPKRG